VLIDSNVPPQDIDLDFINWLGEHGAPLVVIFTKTDRKKSRDGGSVEEFKAKLLETWAELPKIFITSALKETGRQELIDFMEEALEDVPWPFNQVK
jgi:GTP-binding protein